MTVDRTWFNTLVNDSGSGLDGTIWTKEGVGQVLTEVDKTQVCCQVVTSGLSIPAGPFATITWDSEDFDPSGMHNPAAGSNWFVQVPYAGVYALAVILNWAPCPTTVNLAVYFRKQGATSLIPIQQFAGFSIGGQGPTTALTTLCYLNTLEYVDCVVAHGSGTALAINAGGRFSVFRVS